MKVTKKKLKKAGFSPIINESGVEVMELKITSDLYLRTAVHTDHTGIFFLYSYTTFY